MLSSRTIFFFAVVFGASAYACSSASSIEQSANGGSDAGRDVPSEPEEEESSDAGETLDTAPPVCVMNTHTGRKICDDCVQKNCCVVINECLNDDDCSALNECMNECGAKLGHGDAGAQCVRNCAGEHPKSTQKQVDMLDCQFNACATPCKA